MSSGKPKNPYGSLVVYSHSFIVQGYCDRVLATCRKLLDIYSEKKWEKVKNDYGDYVNRQVIDKRFGTMFPDMMTFQFHKGQFNEFRKILEEYNIRVDDLQVEVKQAYIPEKVSYALQEGRVLRDYQVNAKEFGRAEITQGDHFSKLIAMPTGTGKALTADTIVFSQSGGRKKISDCIVGEEILCPDGTYTTILGVYPQGLQERMVITFADGRQAFCDKRHLWDVFVAESDEAKTFSTEEIEKLLKFSKVQIPLFNPFFYHEAAEDFQFALDKVEAVLSVRGSLHEDGIRVPVRSSEDPQELLDLFWSMGSLAYEQLIDGQAFVIVSNRFLAKRFYASVRNNEAGITEDDYLESQAYLGLAIKSIEAQGFEDMVCIEVDHPSNLFVLGNYIVTHNTVTSCGIAADENVRWMVSVLPIYKDKWAGDITDNLALTPKQVMVIDSTDGLRGIIDYCKDYGTKKLQPVLIVTLTTLATFFKAFQKDPQGCVEDYGCEPMDLWKILNIGLVSVDEAHQHILSVYLLALHLHGPKFVCMSGTMVAEDPFVEKIQNVIFPMIKRYNDVKMAKYIEVEFLGYYIHQDIRSKVRFQVFGRQDYSHVEYEKSIMKNKWLLLDFLEMIECMIEYAYTSRKVAGDKVVVYAATVDMANLMIKKFTPKYPELDVRRYAKTEKDPYKNVIESDMTVSTLQSAGTAVDIPGLITVICTTMVNSAKTNLQALGRLRDLKGKRMMMLLPFCIHNKKHQSYTEYRRELFSDRSKSIKTFMYDRHLGRQR